MGEAYRVGLVGESNYQEPVGELRPGDWVEFVPEPENEHDPRAIFARDVFERKLGYLPQDHWLARAMLDEGKIARAEVDAITGGSRGKASRGVVLKVSLAPQLARGQLRFGARARHEKGDAGLPPAIGCLLLIVIVAVIASGGTI